MSSRTIVRVAKNADNPYVSISRNVFEDERLSWRSKGLLGYLLSRPDNWHVMIADLVKRSTEGRDACYRALDELGRCGYLERIKWRAKGRITGHEYVVYEVPDDVRATSWNSGSSKNAVPDDVRATSWNAVSGKTVYGFAGYGKTATSKYLREVSTDLTKKEREGHAQPTPADPSTLSQKIENGEKAPLERPETPVAGSSMAPTGAASPESPSLAGQLPAPPGGKLHQPRSPEQVPGAPPAAPTPTSRDAPVPGTITTLRRAFGQMFLDTLLGELEDRKRWSSLDPGWVDQLVSRVRVEHAGKTWRTPLIVALDAAVARSARTPRAPSPADLKRAEVKAILAAARSTPPPKTDQEAP